VDERIRELIVQGDNRLKQGGAALLPRARESFERALALARESGAEERIAPLVRLRLDEIERLEREAAGG
jgi:hypothetical protein